MLSSSGAVDTKSKEMRSQSTDDAKPPTALAKLYLEDGTCLVGLSFGCHESVEGEVRSYCDSNSLIIMKY